MTMYTDDDEVNAVDMVMGASYLKIKDVAEMLNVSDWLVREWIKDGKLKCLKVGATCRCNLNDVRRFIEKNQNLMHDDDEACVIEA